MNQIRLFIFCCSVMLTTWLAASYTAQLDGSSNRSSQAAAPIIQTGETLAVKTLAPKKSTDSVVGKNAHPIARLK